MTGDEESNGCATPANTRSDSGDDAEMSTSPRKNAGDGNFCHVGFQNFLGVDHAQVGGRLLDRWKFPANMVAAVWFHHTPRAAGEHERLASYLNFGNVIAHLLGHTYGHKSMALQGRGEVLKTLGITQADLEKYLFLTVDELSRVESIFNVRSDAAMA